MQIQIERLENKKTRGENEMLRAESLAIREALLKKTCPTCGGPTVSAEETPEQRRLRMENARLKDEITRAYAVLKNLSRQAAAARYSFAVSTNDVETSGAMVLGSHRPLPSVYPASAFTDPRLSIVEDCVPGRSAANSYTDGASLLRHVDGAMEEFMMLVKNGQPMWLPTADGEVLNNQQYTATTFPGLLGLSPMGFVVVGTRETGTVMGTASHLVDVLTDAVCTYLLHFQYCFRWTEYRQRDAYSSNMIFMCLYCSAGTVV